MKQVQYESLHSSHLLLPESIRVDPRERHLEEVRFILSIINGLCRVLVVPDVVIFQTIHGPPAGGK